MARPSFLISPLFWLLVTILAIVIAVFEVWILVRSNTGEALLVSVITTKALFVSVLAAQIRIAQQQQLKFLSAEEAAKEQKKFESDNATLMVMMQGLKTEVERLKAEKEKSQPKG